MANLKESNAYSSYATVDTDPGAGGFFTDPVTPRRLHDDLFFSIRETEDADVSSADPLDSSGAETDITVVLQFQCKGDDRWQNYNYNDGTVLAIGDRFKIEDTGAGVRWRAGVEAGGYTFGAVKFGFDW